MADPAPQSPLWWLTKLAAALNARQAEMATMDAYYSGHHPLPFLTKAHADKIRNEFRQLLNDSQHNFMRLVVDAAAERLKVEGFRLSASSDATADKKSWDIWQANQMDAESQTAFVEALVKGVSYLSVWEGDEYPTIAVEDPMQTIVAYAPGSGYRVRAAALKVWDDDWTNTRRANVYLPDAIYKFKANRDTSGNPSGSTPSEMRWVALDGADAVVSNPIGVVPIVPLRNRPRLRHEGESELADVYRAQNSINGFLFMLALAGYFGAHRQRWLTGVKIMKDEVTGEEREPFDAAIDRIWQSEDPNAKFGEFQQTQLEPYLKAIEQKVLHIAVTTRTPRHYLFQEGQSPSGDAIQSAESGLVKKVENKQGPFGEGLEEAIRIARRFAGEQDTPVDSEIVWSAAATDNPAVTADAVIKEYQAGLVPWEAALERLGYTQTQIARFAQMRLSDALLQSITNPAPETGKDGAQ